METATEQPNQRRPRITGPTTPLAQMTCVSGPLYVAEPTFERARFAHPSYQTNLAAQARKRP